MRGPIIIISLKYEENKVSYMKKRRLNDGYTLPRYKLYTMKRKTLCGTII